MRLGWQRIEPTLADACIPLTTALYLAKAMQAGEQFRFVAVDCRQVVAPRVDKVTCMEERDAIAGIGLVRLQAPMRAHAKS